MKCEEENIKDRFRDTADDLIEYGRLELDALKLHAVETLAPLSGTIVAMVLVGVVALIALHFLGITLLLLLARWMGSMLCAAAVMTVFFALAALVLYLCRKKMFVRGLVQTYAKMFFKTREERP